MKELAVKSLYIVNKRAVSWQIERPKLEWLRSVLVQLHSTSEPPQHLGIAILNGPHLEGIPIKPTAKQSQQSRNNDRFCFPTRPVLPRQVRIPPNPVRVGYDHHKRKHHGPP